MPKSTLARSAGPALAHPEHPGYAVEVVADAAPDTVSRLLEPVVVMQAVPARVSAVVRPDGATMSVRIDLGGDGETAERLVRKLSGAVTVLSARVVREPAVAIVAAR